MQTITGIDGRIYTSLPVYNKFLDETPEPKKKMVWDKEKKYYRRSDGKKYTLKDNKNRFLFPDEYMLFEDALGKRQKFSVICLINTGARINELINVKKEDVDFERKRIVLRVTKTKAKLKEKKGRIRIIPISTKFAKYLNKKLKHKNSNDFIGILSNSSLNICYKKTGRKIGLKNPGDVSSHTFRKTLETWLMSLGIQDSALLAHFGHDLKTASSHYVSPDIFSYEDKQKIRMIIGDLYGR